MKVRKTIKLLRRLLLIGAIICVVHIINTHMEKVTDQRDAFLIDSFEADVDAFTSEGETWYITIAVDNSKAVIDGAFEEAYKQQLKDFIDLLSSDELMPDETRVWLNISVFDGVIDDDLDKGTTHDVSKGFYKIAGDKSNYRLKNNRDKLKGVIDQISFEATSTFVEGAILGCQQLLDEYVKDTSVQTMILLFTDGFNENIGDDGTGAQEGLVGALKEYNERGSEKIRKAEVVPIGLNFPGDYSEKTKNGREDGRKDLRKRAAKTRYAAGVFVDEKDIRENYCEVENLAELAAALWDVSDYISSKLELKKYGQDGFIFGVHGVKAVHLYMLKPEKTNTNDSIEVFYNGKKIPTKPFGMLLDENDSNQSICYCETVQLASDNSAKLINTIEITYADQKSVKRVYAAFEGLKYEIECSCRPRVEKDGIDVNTFYVGELKLKPYLQAPDYDSKLKVEAHLSNSYYDSGRSDNKPIPLEYTGDKNGSYEGIIPIPDSDEEMELEIFFYVEDEERKKIEQQTIFTKLRLSGKSSVHNFVEGRNVQEAEKTVNEGDSIVIDLKTVLPGISITGIKGESRSTLTFETDKENGRITLRGMKKGENNDYTIKVTDDSNNEWTISGKINVLEKNLIESLFFPALLIVLMILIGHLVCKYVYLSNVLKVTIRDAGGGEPLDLLVPITYRSKNSLYDLINSQTYLSKMNREFFKNIEVRKKLTGQFVISDRNKKVEKTLSKPNDTYSVENKVELVKLARQKVRG